MWKRLIIALILALIAILALLIIWQPDALKHRVLNLALARMNQDSANQIVIQEIHGNIFRTIEWVNIDVIAKATGKRLLHLDRVRFKVAWHALRQKQINLTGLVAELAKGRMEGEGNIQINPHRMSSLRFKTLEFPIHTLIQNVAALPPAVRLVHSGKWEILFATNTWQIQSDGELNQASLSLNVRNRYENIQGKIDLDRLNLGRTGISAIPGANLSSKLSFESHNFELSRLNARGRIRLDLNKPVISSVTADVDIRDGTGRINCFGSQEGATVAGQAGVNLRTQQVKGDWHIEISNLQKLAAWNPALRESSGTLKGAGRIQGTLGKFAVSGRLEGSKLAWRTSFVDGFTADFSARQDRLEQLHLVVTKYRSQSPPGPWDIKSGVLDVRSQGAAWDTEVTADFENASNVATEGSVMHHQEVWECLLKDMTLSIAKLSTPWHLASKETRIRYSDKTLRLSELELKSGSEQIVVDAASYSHSEYQLSMHTSPLSPTLLKIFVPDLNTEGGQMQITLGIRGNAHDVQTQGHLSASIPKLKMKADGLELQNLEVDVSLSSSVLQITRFHANAKKGEIQLSGSSRLPELNFRLDTKDFGVNRDDGIKVNGDVHLKLAGTVAKPDVSGDITLHKGVYNLAKESKKRKKERKEKEAQKELEKKAAAEDKSPTPSLWIRTHVDVNARWDRDVWYRDGITGIETRADLRVQKESGSADLVILGQITSLQGRYAYYGKEFVIESGQIQFTGTPEINPLLNIVASYTSEPTVIYLDVTGTARQPVLKMRSVPPLSEKDIVSVLVFGRTLTEMSPSGGGPTTNQDMTSLAGTVLGSYVTKGLRETGVEQLNLDVVSVVPTDQGNQVVLGRYISRNLFVSYGQTMSENGGKDFIADYYLGRNWAIEGEAGSSGSNHVDFLFRYPINAASKSPSFGPLRNSPFRNSLSNPELNPSSRSTVR